MKEGKHLKAFKENHIKPTETVLAVADGYIGEMMGQGDKKQHNGILIVTDERVCFYRKGILGEVIETIPIKSITSIERKSLIGHRVINMHTSHDNLDFKTFQKEDEARVHEAIEQIRDKLNHAPTPNTDSNKANSDPFDRLRKLTDLKNNGIISDDEFEAKKAEIMKEI